MSKAHILVIDDEAHIRETMCFALDAVGYTTAGAGSGQDGLEKFGTGESWDLVLLDQRMPGMEGVEVLRRMRERDPQARVVLVTAYGSIELAVEAMKGGATDFLRKPFTPDVLRGAVQVALAQPRQTPAGREAARSGSAQPAVSVFTLNGYQFWPAPVSERQVGVARAYEVKSPEGQPAICTVMVTDAARGQALEAAGRALAAEDPAWEPICENTLSNYLLQQAAMPPTVLPVSTLTLDQQLYLKQLGAPTADA